MLMAMDHAERAEHAEGGIDAMVSQAFELDEVGAEAVDVELARICLALHDLEHILRKIDRPAGGTSFDEWNEGASGAATKISDNHTGAHGEKVIDQFSVPLKQLGEGEVVIVVGGDRIGMDVVIGTGGDTWEQFPGRTMFDRSSHRVPWVFSLPG